MRVVSLEVLVVHVGCLLTCLLRNDVWAQSDEVLFKQCDCPQLRFPTENSSNFLLSDLILTDPEGNARDESGTFGCSLEGFLDVDIKVDDDSVLSTSLDATSLQQGGFYFMAKFTLLDVNVTTTNENRWGIVHLINPDSDDRRHVIHVAYEFLKNGRVWVEIDYLKVFSAVLVKVKDNVHFTTAVLVDESLLMKLCVRAGETNPVCTFSTSDPIIVPEKMDMLLFNIHRTGNVKVRMDSFKIEKKDIPVLQTDEDELAFFIENEPNTTPIIPYGKEELVILPAFAGLEHRFDLNDLVENPSEISPSNLIYEIALTSKDGEIELLEDGQFVYTAPSIIHFDREVELIFEVAYAEDSTCKVLGAGVINVTNGTFISPSASPSSSPTDQPTLSPTTGPTTSNPSISPTSEPSVNPSDDTISPSTDTDNDDDDSDDAEQHIFTLLRSRIGVLELLLMLGAFMRSLHVA